MTKWQVRLGAEELNEILTRAFATDGRKVDRARSFARVGETGPHV
jgi:hypothetical protein